MASQYTFFIHMNATKKWLTFTAEERRNFIIHDLAPILRKYQSVTIDFYDAEAFSTYCSDIAVMKTEAIKDYADLMDDLRKSRLFTEPYFEFVNIVPAVEAQYLALTVPA